jgi:hypothetical protein
VSTTQKQQAPAGSLLGAQRLAECRTWYAAKRHWVPGWIGLLLDHIDALTFERDMLRGCLLEQQRALTDIREHVRRYNGKPFLLKDVETRITSVHARPWYPEVVE